MKDAEAAAWLVSLVYKRMRIGHKFTRWDNRFWHEWMNQLWYGWGRK